MDFPTFKYRCFNYLIGQIPIFNSQSVISNTQYTFPLTIEISSILNINDRPLECLEVAKKMSAVLQSAFDYVYQRERNILEETVKSKLYVTSMQIVDNTRPRIISDR